MAIALKTVNEFLDYVEIWYGDQALLSDAFVRDTELKNVMRNSLKPVKFKCPRWNGEVNSAFLAAYNPDLKVKEPTPIPKNHLSIQYVFVTEEDVVGTDGRVLLVMKNLSNVAPGMYDEKMNVIEGMKFVNYKSIIQSNEIQCAPYEEGIVEPWVYDYAAKAVQMNDECIEIKVASTDVKLSAERTLKAFKALLSRKESEITIRRYTQSPHIMLYNQTGDIFITIAMPKNGGN